MSQQQSGHSEQPSTKIAIEPPGHLSSELSEIITSAPQMQYPANWSNPVLVEQFRTRSHPVWEQDNERIDFDYTADADVIAGVPVERVRVGQCGTGALVIHAHGGMFCSGTPKMDRVLNAPLSRQTGLEVISVDYRLAPEHPCPAAIDDVVRVCETIADTGATFVLLGESAGGGVALATALELKRRGNAGPVALSLISPMLDASASSDTYRSLAAVDPDYSDIRVLTQPAAVYAGTLALDDPIASPLFGDLAGLPPTLVQVGSREVLAGDSMRFARRARAAGVSVDLHILDGGLHNYPVFYGVPEADEAVRDIAAHFRGHLGTV